MKKIIKLFFIDCCSKRNVLIVKKFMSLKSLIEILGFCFKAKSIHMKSKYTIKKIGVFLNRIGGKYLNKIYGYLCLGEFFFNFL